MGATPPTASPTGAAANLCSPHHYQSLAGGAGDVDQPLAEKFRTLTLGGSSRTEVPLEQLPRPSAEDLTDPLRLGARAVDGGAADYKQCHPKLMRLTTNALPDSAATKSKAGLPIGAVLQPLARVDEVLVPLVDFGSAGVVRCRRCRTYVNPFITFTDGGRRWRCNVCNLLNDCPSDYICELDSEGRRRDWKERPELHLGAIEIIAPAEYMVRPPQPPAFIFVVEVSYSAVSSGMLRCFAATLQHTIDRLPGGERTQIGLLTFDSSLHFYDLTGASPQMHVVTDVEEVFLPQPKELLVNLHEAKETVASLFERLPAMFAHTQTTEVALGPAIKAAFEVASHVGGKMSVFTCSRPTIGEGKLRNREGGAKANAKEGQLTDMLKPDSDFYKTVAVDCSRQQLCVDMWVCNSAYADLATLGQLPKFTGGSVYHYPGFSDAMHGEKLSCDLQHNLTRHQGLEAVLRVRSSRGLRISNFYGHFIISGSDLLKLPNVDEDKTFAVEIAHEESSLSATSACVQAALLYTTTSGERRIRCLTMEVPITSALSTMFESADVDACTSLMSRVAAEAALNSKLLDGAEKLQNMCMELLRNYRSLCPPHAKNTASLLLPESLALLPLYSLALMKSALFSQSTDVRADERSFLMFMLATMSCHQATSLMHPRLFRVHPADEPLQPTGLPPFLPLSAASLDAAGAYLLDDGAALTLWLGRGVPTQFLQAVFGWPTLEGVDPGTLRQLPPQSSAEAAHLHKLCETARAQRSWGWMPLRVVKQGHADAAVVRSLVEDQTKQMMSYPEYVVHCHRYILSKVS